jgi:hypothetical protein
MLRVVRGEQPATPFQQAFFRAGHAHAGVRVWRRTRHAGHRWAELLLQRGARRVSP